MRGKAGRFSRRIPLNPASISGLTGWWDASDSSTLFDATTGGSLVAADGSVARVEDKSGSGRHFTQANSANRPARKTAVRNGLDVLRFVSNDRMAGTSFGNLFTSTASACFIVASATSVSTDTSAVNGNAAVLSSGGAYHGFFGVRSNGTAYSFGWTGSAQPVVSLSYTAGSFVCFSTLHNGTTLSAAINKTTTGSQSLSTRSEMTGEMIMGANATLVHHFNGDVCEILTYNVVLSDANRSAVENYLMAKWGIE